MVFSCCKFLIMDHKHHCVVSSFQQYMFNNNSVNLTIMIIKGSFWRGIWQGVQYGLSRRRQILRSEVEIEKMHERRKKEDRGWETVKEREIGFKVSLVGLPNSGKSSLFNCLVGERLALVDHHPSMTRDRRQFTIMDGLVTLIDTPGVQVKQKQGLQEDIFKQTITAVHESQLILVVLDSKHPVSSHHLYLLKYLRSLGAGIKLGLVCNKCDGAFDESMLMNEIGGLGMEKVFMCSCEEGTGIFDIADFIQQQIPSSIKQQMDRLKLQRRRKFEALVDKLKAEVEQLGQGISTAQWEHDFRQINPTPEYNADLDDDEFEQFLLTPESAFVKNRGTHINNLRMKHSIKITMIGRPNVGKSSLINEILGEERLVVSEQPHTTRDSIKTKILYKNRKLELIDTAGLNTPNLNKSPEFLKKVQVSTMIHVKEAHVVVYVMDAFSAFKIDDFTIISSAIKEGRPIVIAVNKWEAIKDEYKYKAKNYLKKQIDEHLGELNGYPLVFVSAKMGANLTELMDNIIQIYDKWNSRISTGLLNNWLDRFKKLDNLPKDKQLTLKINYLLQAKVRPPHYIFFVNNKSLFKNNYLRFLTSNLAKQFKMEGVPLRITLRSSNNKEKSQGQKMRREKKVGATKLKMEELKKKYDNFGL